MAGRRIARERVGTLPRMPDDRRQRVESLFLAAVELPADRRAALLAGEPDELVRREVASLLGHAEASSGSQGGSGGLGGGGPEFAGPGFLDSKDAPGRALQTGIGGAAAAAHVDEPLLPPGTVVGRYTLRGVVGAGGMGVVYIAEQDRPRRTVALKVLRAGIASARMLRRFEFEAEILGRLQHPGIAQVYEAGAFAEGRLTRPYIAMELVRGAPLIEAARQRGLGTRQKLELLAKVCDAVQHAHQVGVIHRDLKPANILVADAAPDRDGARAGGPGGAGASGGFGSGPEALSPKVLDFGVARGLERDGAVTTLQTAAGQIVGTLPYMSPEQLDGEESKVDTRSDVYALGVVGYELLSGRLPLDLAKASLAEAARILRDQTPVRLSLIDRSLAGDIEVIFATALAKDPNRRYRSAAELAADIRRHLAGQPIAARQDSALYVFSTFVRRNKPAVFASLAGLAGVLSFAVWVAIQAEANANLAAERALETAKAVKAQERADETAGRLAQELSLANLERGRLQAQAGNLSAAEDLLWPEHLRSLNAHHPFYALWELYSILPCLATMPAQGGRIYGVAVSPAVGGGLAATGGSDPGIIIFDAVTHERLRGIETSSPAFSLAFNHDGSALACGELTGRVSVFRPADGSLIRRLWEPREVIATLQEDPVPEAGPCAVSFAPDGALYAAFTTGEVRCWRPDGTPAGVVVLKERIASVRVSPDGALVAICTTSGLLRVYSPDLSTWRDLAAKLPRAATQVAFSPSGRLLAVGGQDSMLEVFEVDSGRQVARLTAPVGAIRGIEWGSSEDQLFSAGWWMVVEWDLTSRSVRRRISSTWSDSSMAVNPEGGQLWTTVRQGVRVWDVAPQKARMLHPLVEGRTVARQGPFGHTLAGDADGSVVLIDARTGEPGAVLGKFGRRIRSIAFSPAAPLAATSGVDGVLRLWDLSSGTLAAQWPQMRCPTNRAIAFSADGRRLISPAQDLTFRVIDVATKQVTMTLPSDGEEPLAACFSPDGARIAAVTRRPYVSIYDASTGRLLARPACGDTPWSLAFSPDGRWLACGDWGRGITVWEPITGAVVRRFEGHTALVTDLAFRVNEPNILASCSTDGTIRFWDLSTAASTASLTLRSNEEESGLWNLDFHPARPELMCTNGQGLVSVWRLRYFNRHILGNLQWQYARLKGQTGMPAESEVAGQAATMKRGIRSALQEGPRDTTTPVAGE